MQTKAKEAFQASSVDINSPSNHETLERFQPISPREEERADEMPWEERYEKIWVENEKKETKSQYKNVAAELKEKFGELEHKEEDDLSEQEDNQEEQKGVIKADEEDSSEEEGDPIVRPIARARSAMLLPIPEQRESGLEDSLSESVHHMVSIEASDAELPNDPHHSQIIPEALMQPENTADDDDNEADGEPESGSNLNEGRQSSLLVDNELEIPDKVVEVPSFESEDAEEGLWKSRLEVGPQWRLRLTCLKTFASVFLPFIHVNSKREGKSSASKKTQMSVCHLVTTLTKITQSIDHC